VVMDFIEHDLKSLLTMMPSPFLQSEIKTLMLQLLSAVGHCHSNWILHRDLKTSNLLMNNRGTIKVADFGLARRYGDPVGVGGMTQLVVTLWYRYVFLGIIFGSYTDLRPQSPRNPPWRNNVLNFRGPMVCRVYFCRTSSQGAPFSSEGRDRTSCHDFQAPGAANQQFLARLF